MIKKLTSCLLDIFFPLSCIGCDVRDTVLCESCLNSIPIQTKLALHPTPHLDFVLICGNYEHPLLKEMIRFYKFQGVTSFAKQLSRIMTRVVAVFPVLTNPVLIPIPLHWRKKRARGYNQSELLAHYLAQDRSLPLDCALKKVKATRSQSKLNRAERLTNVVGAFRYNGMAPREIILIDDIATTFSTLESAAKELKRRGAEHVGGLVLAQSQS